MKYQANKVEISRIRDVWFQNPRKMRRRAMDIMVKEYSPKRKTTEETETEKTV